MALNTVSRSKAFIPYAPAAAGAAPSHAVVPALPNRARSNILNKMVVELLTTVNSINDKYYAAKKAREELQKSKVIAPSSAQVPALGPTEQEIQEKEVREIAEKAGFVFQRYLGAGTHGSAYLLTDKQNNFTAIKMLHRKWLNPKYNNQELIGNEAKVLSIFSKNNIHNVPHIKTPFSSDGGKTICGVQMTALNAPNLLESCINAGNPKVRYLSIDEILSFFTPKLLTVLADIEKLGIVHTDIKPENIIYTDLCQFMLVDWGSAKFFSKDKEIKAYATSRWYRSLETVLKRPLDCSIDMWSAACVIYELYMRRPLLVPNNPEEHVLWMVGRFGKDQVKECFKNCGKDSSHIDQLEIKIRSWKEAFEETVKARGECPRKANILLGLLDLIFRFKDKKRPTEVLDYLRSELNRSVSEASPIPYSAAAAAAAGSPSPGGEMSDQDPPQIVRSIKTPLLQEHK